MNGRVQREEEIKKGVDNIQEGTGLSFSVSQIMEDNRERWRELMTTSSRGLTTRQDDDDNDDDHYDDKDNVISLVMAVIW